MSKRTLTQKQKNVIKNITENVSSTKKEILLKSGYSDSVSNQPDKILNSKPIKKALNDHRDVFEGLMQDAVKQAQKTVKQAKYGEAIKGIDTTKKHLNIIDGVGNGEQSNIIVIPGEIVNRYDNIIDGEVEEVKKIKPKS